jgi:hypothetical protein
MIFPVFPGNSGSFLLNSKPFRMTMTVGSNLSD